MHLNFNLIAAILFSNNIIMQAAQPAKHMPSYQEVISLVYEFPRLPDDQKLKLVPYVNTLFGINNSGLETPLGMALGFSDKKILECIKFLLENGADTTAPVMVTSCLGSACNQVYSPFCRLTKDHARIKNWAIYEYRIVDAINLMLPYHDSDSFKVSEKHIKPEWRGHDNHDPLIVLKERQKFLKDHPEVLSFTEEENLDSIVPALESHINLNRWSVDRRAWCGAVARSALQRSSFEKTNRVISSALVPTVGKPSTCCRELM